MTSDEPSSREDPSSCTAVLTTAPQEAAERILAFLRANAISSEVRPAAGGPEIGELWDVLVRPEDLPAPEGVVEVSGDEPPEPPPAAEDAPAPASGTIEPVVLCELPWNEAWRLTERLIADGIPAAVMAGEGADRDRPMSDREVSVGVRPDDLERARAFLA